MPHDARLALKAELRDFENLGVLIYCFTSIVLLYRHQLRGDLQHFFDGQAGEHLVPGIADNPGQFVGIGVVNGKRLDVDRIAILIHRARGVRNILAVLA